MDRPAVVVRFRLFELYGLVADVTDELCRPRHYAHPGTHRTR
jgi:hypothetical protein